MTIPDPLLLGEGLRAPWPNFSLRKYLIKKTRIARASLVQNGFHLSDGVPLSTAKFATIQHATKKKRRWEERVMNQSASSESRIHVLNNWGCWEAPHPFRSLPYGSMILHGVCVQFGIGN